eukprot:3018022-Rhodomonas_salina.2
MARNFGRKFRAEAEMVKIIQKWRPLGGFLELLHTRLHTLKHGGFNGGDVARQARWHGNEDRLLARRVCRTVLHLQDTLVSYVDTECDGFKLLDSAQRWPSDDAGASITIASPKGGQPPVDPKSEEEGFLSAYTKRFAEDADAQKLAQDSRARGAQRLSESIKLDEALKDHSKFDALFYPGGHGPLWDLTNNPKSIELIQSFWNADKPVRCPINRCSMLKNLAKNDGTRRWSLSFNRMNQQKE